MKTYNTIIEEYNGNDNPLFKNVNMLSENGNLFVITYRNTNMFDYIEYISKFGYKYVNIIIAPKVTSKFNSYITVLWFVKNYSKMYFDKDRIREKHIWKDVEWGKRKKNYNPLGKDPGNVWIPTLDDGNGKITKHLHMNLYEIINRCLDATITNEMHALVSLNDPNVFISERSNIEVVANESSYNENKINVFSNIKCHYKTQTNKVFFESSEKMYDVEDESIGLIITSPPYWDLKNYFKKGQIGQESYKAYLKRMSNVWIECYKVLREGGALIININIRMKNKTLIPIPNDIINSCKEIGFNLYDIIIWHKSSGIPTRKNNIVDRHEYLLVFYKGESIGVNIDEFKSFNDYKKANFNKGNLWNINRKAGSIGKDYVHPAIYPVELINRCIRLFTVEGEIVLDPFLGSGTTVISAINNNRVGYGYEFNEGFKDLINYRFKKEIRGNYDVEFVMSKTKIKTNKIFR